MYRGDAHGGKRLPPPRGNIGHFLTGVGFFDVNHLQVGRSRSCIELHPILTIERVSEYCRNGLPSARLIHRHDLSIH